MDANIAATFRLATSRGVLNGWRHFGPTGDGREWGVTTSTGRTVEFTPTQAAAYCAMLAEALDA